MINYADETFYKSNYLCGKQAVITAAFDYYARQATQIIRQYTFDRIDTDNVAEEVKMCCCDIAELIFNSEQADSKSCGVTSATVGDVSESYESAESRRQLMSQEINTAIKTWLSGTGLLYRGVC